MKALFATIAILSLAACSGINTRWQHAEIPPLEWGVDGAQCKYKARRKAEREYDEASTGESNLYDDSDLTINGVMIGANITKRTRELFADCMQGLGYTPVE
jgi:hypothetical protein